MASSPTEHDIARWWVCWADVYSMASFVPINEASQWLLSVLNLIDTGRPPLDIISELLTSEHPVPDCSTSPVGELLDLRWTDRYLGAEPYFNLLSRELSYAEVVFRNPALVDLIHEKIPSTTEDGATYSFSPRDVLNQIESMTNVVQIFAIGQFGMTPSEIGSADFVWPGWRAYPGPAPGLDTSDPSLRLIHPVCCSVAEIQGFMAKFEDLT